MQTEYKTMKVIEDKMKELGLKGNGKKHKPISK